MQGLPARVGAPLIVVGVCTLGIAAARGQDAAAPAGDESLLFQDIPMVYGASRFEQSTAEAPAAVTVITAAEIRTYGYRTLADILRAVRGFYITSDRNYNYVGVRGFGRPGDYNSRLLLQIDGHRVNDDIYASASVGTEGLVDVDLIDRVEIIRGPGSSLYGTGAFFGVINVITKRGRDIDGGQIGAEAGSLDTYKGRLTYGKKLDNGAEILLSGTGYYSGGQRDLYFPEFDTPATNNGIAHNLDQDHYSQFQASLAISDFKLQAGSVTRIKNLPTASFGSVFDAEGSNTTDTRQYVDAAYRHSFGAAGDLSARLYFDRYVFRGNYLTDATNGSQNLDLADDEWWGSEIQYGVTLHERHHLTVGVEFIDSFRQELRNFDTIPFQQNVSSDTSSHQVAFYAQDEYRLLDNLIFNLGLRYDDFSDRGSSTNPRAALIWLPRQGTSLKLLYGTAFRAPNIYERFWGGNSGSVNSLNPALVPEKIRTGEAIWEQQYGHNFSTVLSAYRYRLEHLITLVPDPAHPPQFVFVNSEPIRATGVGFEIAYRGNDGIEARSSITYQDSKVESTDARLSNSPYTMIKASLAVPLWARRLTAGVEWQYYGPRRTLAGNNLGGYAVTNLTVSTRELWRHFELSASVYNLFDKRYLDPGTGNMVQDQLEQDGRVFLAKALYRF